MDLMTRLAFMVAVMLVPFAGSMAATAIARRTGTPHPTRRAPITPLLVARFFDDDPELAVIQDRS